MKFGLSRGTEVNWFLGIAMVGFTYVMYSSSKRPHFPLTHVGRHKNRMCFKNSEEVIKDFLKTACPKKNKFKF